MHLLQVLLLMLVKTYCSSTSIGCRCRLVQMCLHPLLCFFEKLQRRMHPANHGHLATWTGPSFVLCSSCLYHLSWKDNGIMESTISLLLQHTLRWPLAFCEGVMGMKKALTRIFSVSVSGPSLVYLSAKSIASSVSVIHAPTCLLLAWYLEIA